jgi:hypothetical protein
MMRLFLLASLTGGLLLAGGHQGVVKFGGLPVPGVSVTASQGTQKFTAITDMEGKYAFAELTGGVWTVQVEMQLFVGQRREVSVADAATPAEWELEPAPTAAPTSALPAAPRPGFQRAAVTAAAPNRPPPPKPDPTVASELAQRAADGLLINGSVNNGAASPFAQLPAFGNFRRGQRSLYNGSLGVSLNNAVFDARAYSLTGQNTPKPAYSRVQGLFAFGGPIKIPKLLQRNGPNLTLTYQWTRNTNANTQTGLMPTAAERAGDLSGSPRQILDVTSGAPLPGNLIPASRVSPQARALAALFPLPNFAASNRYNYQVPVVSHLHQDDLQTRGNKQKRGNFYSANFSWQSVRTDTPDLFSFLDTGSVQSLSTGATYRRSYSPRAFTSFGFQYSRQTTRATPYYAGRQNVSAEAGIAGNNQDSLNWGPPALMFSSGLSPLATSQASLNRNQTSSVQVDSFLSRARHYLLFGGSHRRQQFNVLSQQDARGTFGFTGAAGGTDLSGFLQGVPDTSSIAFGNADKYLRATINEAYFSDDWRVNPGLTINSGLRWEYWSPVREKYGRLVNLQVGPGYSTATPVVAAQDGTGQFPRRDINNLSPRVAFSWRPLPASSLVIRGGYGIYYDTSVYQGLAMQMAQQAPLSKNLRVANSPERPLTLANGFGAAGATSAPTFAVDPDFRVGYAQTWQFSLQGDVPAGLQVTATYSGSKGTRSQQQFLPNTVPTGAVNPCLGCPSGFTYLTSNGNSTRPAAQIQARRRLRSGFTASLNYTFAKALDNAALGGRGQSQNLIAQNWLDLGAERARSNFDQRHLLTASAQYTSGMGLKGGALASGWAGRLLKEWTLGTEMTAGSGLPLTPVYQSVVLGTGVTGSLRPDFTGAGLYDAPGGLHLNPAALAAPAPGQWGNAGRNSINGPSQFTLNASMGRTFRSSERISLDLRIEATNALNRVTYPSWNTVAGSAQFGLPMMANPMRSVQAVIRMRY